MTRFRLSTVLRVRKAQEDAAKAAVARARAEVEVAAVRVRGYERDLDESGPPTASTATAFAAAMSARQGLASALYAAIGAASQADETVQEHVETLVDAAVQRRTIEKLEERHAAARRHAGAATAQRAVDDLTSAAYHRRGDTAGDAS
jgi:flagellar export protein FliJ